MDDQRVVTKKPVSSFGVVDKANCCFKDINTFWKYQGQAGNTIGNFCQSFRPVICESFIETCDSHVKPSRKIIRHQSPLDIGHSLGCDTRYPFVGHQFPIESDTSQSPNGTIVTQLCLSEWQQAMWRTSDTREGAHDATQGFLATIFPASRVSLTNGVTSVTLHGQLVSQPIGIWCPPIAGGPVTPQVATVEKGLQSSWPSCLVLKCPQVRVQQ